MSYKEFRESSERSIVKNGMMYDFTKVRDGMWLIEVSLPSLHITTGETEGHEWITCTSIVTEIEAYYVYENILKGGLE